MTRPGRVVQPHLANDAITSGAGAANVVARTGHDVSAAS
jgi:hypothetical protein